MTIHWRKTAKIATSIVDQAWLSGISLIISLVLARTLEKEDFGLYILLSNSVLFFQGICSAIISSPYTTIHSKKKALACRPVEILFSKLTIFYGVASFLVSLILYLIYKGITEDCRLTLLAGIAFSTCVIGSVFRDNIRILHYSLSDPVAALRNNILYGGMVLLFVFILFILNKINTANMLFVIGISGILASKQLASNATSRTIESNIIRQKKLIVEFWDYGKWALLGAFLTFIASNTHPYIAAASFSKTDVADIAAARLLTVPIALLSTAWSNMMRPLLSRWTSTGQVKEITSTINKSVLGVIALTIIGIIIIQISNDFIKMIFGEKYSNLNNLTSLWMLYAGSTFIKGIYAGALMTNNSGYRQLSRIATINLVAMICLMLLASRTSHPESIVVVLLLLELLQIALITRNRNTWQACDVKH